MHSDGFHFIVQPELPVLTSGKFQRCWNNQEIRVDLLYGRVVWVVRFCGWVVIRWSCFLVELLFG